jgi:hypothetical protein
MNDTQYCPKCQIHAPIARGPAGEVADCGKRKLLNEMVEDGLLVINGSNKNRVYVKADIKAQD